MSGSCKKQKLYCCCMQSARQDLIHMAASREKHRGEATCEEQARPNNDDEPSNHVGLCYDTVMEKHCWLSLHIMQVCVVTRRALNEEGWNQRPLATPNSDLLHTQHEAPTYRVTAAAPPPHPQDQCCFLVLITAAASFQSVRSSQQDIFVNLDSGGCRGGANMWPERPFELGRNTCAVTAGGTSQLQDEMLHWPLAMSIFALAPLQH